MEIKALGVGTPTPAASSWGSSFLVTLGEERMLFDCGPGTTHKMVRSGTLPTDVTQLFLTHLHFDHVVDVPALLLSRWDQGADRISPIEVYGPQPTARFIDDIVGTEGLFRDDIKARIEHPTSQAVHVNRGGILPRIRPRTVRTELTPSQHVGNDRWRVQAGHAEHVQPYLDSLAYRLDSDTGSVVFTGDTEPCESVIELSRGADVLFAMCWDLQSRMARTNEERGVTGTEGAARMAREAAVGKLVLVHHGPQLDADDARQEACDQVAAGFDGEVVFANEGLVVRL